MRLLGLSGYARSGKDTAAEVLVEAGWERIAFADKLRDMLYAINPLIQRDPKSPRAWWQVYIPNTVRLRDIIDEFGWDGYKSTVWAWDIRELLQRLGTQGGRETLWDSIWVDAAFHDLKEDGKYVCSDMRFPNEMGAILDRGGMAVRITRAGVGPANQHESEISLDDTVFDSYIRNDGTLEEFREKVRRAFL